jgi:hypothetical protein
MAKDKRRREKPVSTGSIALRIGLSSGLNLLLIFIILDVILFGIFVVPGITDGSGNIEIIFNDVDAFYKFIREWKIDIILRTEGLL